MADYYWSAQDGVFVDKVSGQRQKGASFNGNWREWRETLVETVIDVCNMAVRENGNQPIDDTELLCDPEIADLLRSSVLFKDDVDYPTLGVIGEPVRGVLSRRLPVRGIVGMIGSSKAKLVKKGMSGHKVLGTITVLDLPDYLDPDRPKSRE